MAKLTIWVHKKWTEHPKVVELKAAGHTIYPIDEEEAYRPDLILHPNAWRWDDGKWDFTEVALKEARKGQPKPAAASKAGSKPRRGKGPKGAA